jgi:hypothetical protein
MNLYSWGGSLFEGAIITMTNQHTQFDLLRETVGKTLNRAISDLGCPSLPEDLLTAEHRTFLQNEVPGLPADAQELNRLLIGQAMKGKILRVGSATDGSSLFTVRFPLSGRACVFTFAYYQEVWRLHDIEAIQTRAFVWNRLLLGAVAGSALTLLATWLTGWGLNGGDVAEEAKKQGYVVMTQDEYQKQVIASAQGEGAANGDPKAAQGSNANAKNGKVDTGQQVTFALKEGMTTSDLTQFLKQEGLIENQAAFNQQLTQRGIDTMLRPKEYVFKKGMSEQEILNVLQS